MKHRETHFKAPGLTSSVERTSWILSVGVWVRYIRCQVQFGSRIMVRTVAAQMRGASPLQAAPTRRIQTRNHPCPTLSFLFFFMRITFKEPLLSDAELVDRMRCFTHLKHIRFGARYAQSVKKTHRQLEAASGARTSPL